MVELHIIFFPLMAHGHMIPLLDMAKLFASRGLKTTMVSTPAFAGPIHKVQESGFDIGLTLINFPPEESGLPDHITSLDKVTSDELLPKFFKALALLQEPFEKLMEELNPSCLVSDMFLPWTTESAAKFGIPRLVFHGTSYIALCCLEQMKRHKPFKSVESDSEPFVLPDLPHELKFVRTQVADFDIDEHHETMFAKAMEKVRDSDWRSYGVVMNSFCELEPEYVEHYRKVLGRRAWSVGPLLLCNTGVAEVDRGKTSAIDENQCLSWLDSKKPNSVIYSCFGSMPNFTPAQLREIGIGLETSGQDFIWALRKVEEDQQFLPEGFEERVRNKGLIIRGWAPQVMILNHPAIGAFVTHCGWNSILEGICAGVPMVTWPLFAEQFYNEKLVTEVVKIGVSVGNKTWQRAPNEGISNEAVAEAVQRVMVGDSAAEMRRRARDYRDMARKAVEEGGSSHNDLSALIQELRAYSQAI